MTDLADLIKRVEGATEPNFDLELAVHAIVHPATGPIGPAYTASVDAVIELIEEKMPGALWSLNNRSMAGVWRPGQDVFTDAAGSYPKDNVEAELIKPPALALLLAFLRAWSERDA